MREQTSNEKVSAPTCPFCNYRGPLVADYGDIIVFEPLHPVTDGHVLVVPKAHVPSALAAPKVAGLVMEVAAQHANMTDIGACNLITSVGPQATQTVWHLHLHLVPRCDGDGLQLPWTQHEPQGGDDDG